MNSSPVSTFVLKSKSLLLALIGYPSQRFIYLVLQCVDQSQQIQIFKSAGNSKFAPECGATYVSSNVHSLARYNVMFIGHDYHGWCLDVNVVGLNCYCMVLSGRHFVFRGQFRVILPAL